MQKPRSIYKIIKQRRLSSEVVNQITDLILQNHLQPGDKLPPERQLAAEPARLAQAIAIRLQ